jgi:hypothetical protein
MCLWLNTKSAAIVRVVGSAWCQLWLEGLDGTRIWVPRRAKSVGLAGLVTLVVLPRVAKCTGRMGPLRRRGQYSAGGW